MLQKERFTAKIGYSTAMGQLYLVP